MGIIYAGLRVANDPKPELEEIDAEALHLCIPEHVAAQLQLSQKKHAKSSPPTANRT